MSVGLSSGLVGKLSGVGLGVARTSGIEKSEDFGILLFGLDITFGCLIGSAFFTGSAGGSGIGSGGNTSGNGAGGVSAC